MSEEQKAEALSRSLDALLQGQEGDSLVSVDEEIRALSELGRSLYDIEFEPSPAYLATVERLLLEHRVQNERSVMTGRSRSNGFTIKEAHMETPTTQKPKKITARFFPERFVESAKTTMHPLLERFTPLKAFPTGVAVLFICALIVLIGGGVAWRAFRDARVVPNSTSVSVSEAGLDQSNLPSPGPTAETSLAQSMTSDASSELPYIVFLPNMSSPLSSQSARLQDIRGVVEIQTDDDTWTFVSESQVIKAGQRVRIGALSSASLAFFDGSTAYLGPNTEVSMDHLGRDPTDGSRIVELTQWVGETDHDVAPAYGDNARYEVHTPSGTGEAMGTSFQVLVTPALFTRFSVDTGVIAVTNLNVTVIVVAGQLTIIPVDQPPSEPVFRITGEGEVVQTGTTWTIAGQDFETHNGTVIIGNPQVGDWVSVDGHLLPDGTRIADRIVLLRRSPEDRFSITGQVEAIEDTAWTVAEQIINVNEETDIEEGIEIEDLVRVEGVIQQEGSLLAERIRLIEEEPGLPFQFIGVVQDIGGEHWTISGNSITVNAATELDEGLAIGDTVEVQGWILDDETWLARSIRRIEEEERRFEFTGYVESIDPWMVSGIAFETRAWTEIEAGIEIGDRVRAKGQILSDGTWVASEVERFNNDDGALHVVFVGTVTSKDPWMVSGIPLVIDDDTVIVGNIRIGDLVRVRARILPDGTWLAKGIRRIGVRRPGLGCYSFSTVVVGINGNQLELLNGETVDLGDGVVIEGDVAVNSIIVIAVCVDADGTVTVMSIIVILYPPPPPSPPPSSPCGPCRGGVTNLTLRYVGIAENAHIQVLGKRGGILFDGIVQPGGTFSFSGTGKHGKLDKEITIVVNGRVDTKIHTSCSKPIGPGVVFGDFQVVAGHSKDGGAFCRVPAPSGGDDGGGGSKGNKGSKGSKGSEGKKGSKGKEP